jgi:threonine/homoserine/homoserine lactone efflux protein
MHGVLAVLLGVTMLGVLGVLGAGMLGVVRGNDPMRSNRLMRWRVILQGVALALFALLLLTRK